MKGFALLLSLLLLLLLTLFGFSLLLMAGSHYASARSLFENENARIACESAAWFLVGAHNSESGGPRFFQNPQSWSGEHMRPFDWNGYRVTGKLSAPWTAAADNLFTLAARKGTYQAQVQMTLRQRRPENFALFADDVLTLPTASLVDGLVFVRNTLNLLQPDVRFRGFVQADVFPMDFASYRKKTLQTLDYPRLDTLLPFSELVQQAIVIGKDHLLFRKGDHYDLNLDSLTVSFRGENPFILYQGVEIGKGTLLYFDDQLRVHQTNYLNPHPTAQQHDVPLYLFSSSEIVIESNLQPLQSGTRRHPLCFLTTDTIRLGPSMPRSCRIDACLAALGGDTASMVIEPGGTDLTSDEKETLVAEINSSTFLVEALKQASFIDAVKSGEKTVWFRGSLLLGSSLQVPPELTELHFQASQASYSLLPSFPFVYVVEGSHQWR